MIVHDDYKLGDPDALETPAMLVFEELVDGNIRTMCELAGGAENLMVHVKTHKAAAITRKKIDAGVAGFKCATLKELEMVLEEGGQEAIMAYPLVQQRKVERFAALVAAYPEARIHAIVSTQLHIDVLGRVAAENQRVLKAMLDLDLGMHRVWDRSHYLGTRLIEGLDSAGAEVISPRAADEHSGIVTFRVEGMSRADLQGYLAKDFKIRSRGIYEGGLDAVRVAPHIYSAATDVDRVIEAVEALKL